MTNHLDSTETMTARAVTEYPQPNARAASPQADRPLRHAPRPAGAPKPPRRDDDDEDEGFFQRFRVPIIIGAVVLAGVAFAVFSKPSATKAPVKAPPQQIVRIQPLPPPPPPPPKVQPPPPKPEEKKMEQAPVEKPEAKPEPPKPKPADEPEALGTGLKGSGPGLSGLGTRGNGGGGNGLGGGGGDLFAWYAGQAVQPITAALRSHSRTKSASMNVIANIWVDGAGKISRAQLASSTGDAAMDAAIQNEVLPGVRLSEPPPPKMKMPIKLRLNARRPR